MPYDKKSLIDYRIRRAGETVQEADMSLRHNRFNLAENRIYYAMFYIVQALAVKLQNGFAIVRDCSRH